MYYSQNFVVNRNIPKIIICIDIMAVSAIFICAVEKMTETLCFHLVAPPEPREDRAHLKDDGA